MATEPFRLRVLKGLTATLEAITPDAGYHFDMTKRVYRGRTMFGSETRPPFISILEVPLPLDQFRSSEGNVAQAGPWDLIVQGFIDDDQDNPTDPAHFLMADVKRALVLAKRNRIVNGTLFGSEAVYDLTIGPGIVRPPDEVSAGAYFWMGLVIHMVEDLENPFAE